MTGIIRSSTMTSASEVIEHSSASRHCARIRDEAIVSESGDEQISDIWVVITDQDTTSTHRCERLAHTRLSGRESRASSNLRSDAGMTLE